MTCTSTTGQGIFVTTITIVICLGLMAYFYLDVRIQRGLSAYRRQIEDHRREREEWLKRVESLTKRMY